MQKAKLPRPTAAKAASSAAATTESTAAPAAEIEALNAKIAKMQTEIDGLKKQLAQIMAFIKQKLK
jgi:uncharacterized protein YceH (UPF0502 family)